MRFAFLLAAFNLSLFSRSILFSLGPVVIKAMTVAFAAGHQHFPASASLLSYLNLRYLGHYGLLIVQALGLAPCRDSLPASTYI